MLVRFPNLKLALRREPDRLDPVRRCERVDKVWEDNQGWAQSTSTIPEPPSTYYYRAASTAASSTTRTGSTSLDEVGVDNVTFETDYPHSDSTWPDTKEVAARLVADLSDDEVDKIVRGNAIKLLDLDLA